MASCQNLKTMMCAVNLYHIIVRCLVNHADNHPEIWGRIKVVEIDSALEYEAAVVDINALLVPYFPT